MSARATDARVRAERLRSHGLHTGMPSIVAAVERIGAMQAQDFGAARWALGVRVPGSVEADVDAAFAARRIVRTWPLRGTLHIMAAERLREVLALTGPRIHQKDARRRRELELDDDVAGLARHIAERELALGPRTRDQLQAAWEAAGIATGGQRGYHLLAWLALDAVICLGPAEGRDQRFVLVEDWLPASPRRERDEALATLITSYFRGHGPATVRDAAWWSGLTLTDVRTAVAAAGDALTAFDDERLCAVDTADVEGASSTAPRASGRFALPAFDEYFLGYADRSPVCDPGYAGRVVPGGNGVFQAILVDAGRVVGLWRRRDARRGATVTLDGFETDLDARAFRRPLADWSRFRGVPLAEVRSG
ncbi:winged helix DNA-binding domain-containing protein [Agromyces silvae]|uniref:winged helix DNA-binding domain-containing protein n=1 Tax=Agromyces silvae TaxID=3388266 RepID=UPI00280C26F3|nr:winged helix DNA-binding domain-containing protein [Agromyces protaetiae]